mgnify:CR=1 FL=1|jgi:hypothetical protein
MYLAHMEKEYIKIYKEGNNTIMETLLPNDQHGDFAFEWDIDGSRRKAWDEHMKDLERKGTRGDLVYTKWTIPYDPLLDESDLQGNYPLESYKMIIEDYGN